MEENHRFICREIGRTPNFEYKGIFDSVDEKGQLIIINNGEKKKIAAAEIFF